MEVVAPLGVEAVAAHRRRPHQPGVVEVALRHQEQRPPDLVRQVGHPPRHLLQDVDGGRVEDGVHRVQPEAVGVEVPEPHEGVVDHERPHLVAAGPVEVHRLAPRGVVPVGEVGPELAEVVPGRPEVVVDDVDHHRQAPGVGRVDQPLEAVGTAVGGVGGEQVDAVVAPSPPAGELVDGQELHHVDTKCRPGGRGGRWRRRTSPRARRCPRAARRSPTFRRARRPRQPPSVHPKAAWSTARERPSTPSGCHGERGSGRVGPPSSEKP